MTFCFRCPTSKVLSGVAVLLIAAAAGRAETPRTATKAPVSQAPPEASSAKAKTSSASRPAAPTSRSYIASWPTGKKLVALTYDDGPDPRYTPKLIELLQAKNVPATFYVLGQRVKEYPEIAKRLHELGFEVVNHTFSHKLLTKLSDADVRSQLNQTNELITSITGAPVTHMRPPYGGRNARVDSIIRDLGMQIVLWDVDTEDWRKRSAAQMTSTILKQAGDGSIILFHDRYQSSLDSTAAVVDALRERGYTFVTVGELLAQPRAGSSSAMASENATTFSATRSSE